jgi:hypothetical protein
MGIHFFTLIIGVKDTQDEHIGIGINFFTIIHGSEGYRMSRVGIGNEQE